jgi:hypothetical protein
VNSFYHFKQFFMLKFFQTPYFDLKLERRPHSCVNLQIALVQLGLTSDFGLEMPYCESRLKYLLELHQEISYLICPCWRVNVHTYCNIPICMTQIGWHDVRVLIQGLHFTWVHRNPFHTLRSVPRRGRGQDHKWGGHGGSSVRAGPRQDFETVGRLKSLLFTWIVINGASQSCT